ncbi:hypothetical protein [Thauera sp. 27]|uniref:hypothetical protein n=1 Tax=Thauera sp. 27 TaxID=305700 RepID=UPI0012FB0B8D|nr:hypothetical protein [Thauera sp. 27]
MSPSHLAARAAAARLPALYASLAMLDSGVGRARIELLDAGATVLAVVWMQDGAGGVDESAAQLVLTTPMEGAIAAAGTPVAARIRDATGALWADGLTVSDDGPESAGDIRLADTDLVPGHFVRITLAVIQG